MRLKCLGTAAILTVASPAFAGWQNTRWGTSPAEVSKGMGVSFPAGDPHRANPDDGYSYALSKYSAGYHNFSVVYQFKAAKLASVQLTLVGGGGCGQLSDDMHAKYGKPVEEDMAIPNRRLWRDVNRDNRVELKTYTDGFCTISYMPLKSSAAAGL